jgi:hypothetical protein
VATWLAVLVPMIARRRQPMSRPSDAALSCRVLERPRKQRRRNQEVTAMDSARTEATAQHQQPASAAPESGGPGTSERPGSARYRPGRGGYDAEAAALAAEARYTFRQRMVLILVLFAIISAVLAATLRMIDAWYLHGAVDLSLIGYLVYLRRQVRLEQTIRARREARGAGTRRGGAIRGERVIGRAGPGAATATAATTAPSAATTTELSGQPTTVAQAVAARQAERQAQPGQARRAGAEAGSRADREAVGPAEAAVAPATTEEFDEQHPALPRLTPTPPPQPLPGTVRLELDDEDPELHDLADRQHKGYRRAAGQ